MTKCVCILALLLYVVFWKSFCINALQSSLPSFLSFFVWPALFLLLLVIYLLIFLVPFRYFGRRSLYRHPDTRTYMYDAITSGIDIFDLRSVPSLI